MAKYPETQCLENIANLLRDLKRFAPGYDVSITQAIYNLEGIAKDFDQRIYIHIAERTLINKAAQQQREPDACPECGEEYSGACGKCAVGHERG